METNIARVQEPGRIRLWVANEIGTQLRFIRGKEQAAFSGWLSDAAFGARSPAAC